MTNSILPLDVETLSLSTKAAKEIGGKYAGEYSGRNPYPYGAFDNFLPDQVLERVLQDLSQLPEAKSSFNRP